MMFLRILPGYRLSEYVPRVKVNFRLLFLCYIPVMVL